MQAYRVQECVEQVNAQTRMDGRCFTLAFYHEEKNNEQRNQNEQGEPTMLGAQKMQRQVLCEEKKREKKTASITPYPSP